MSTIFIAVQCYQCSTMQVKQQRRSGNKWICAVCNEKQSVQKVFARATMAKDVRQFVQSFNMSRKYADEQMRADEQDEGINAEDKLACSARKKMRSDWSEFLDSEDDRSGNGRGNEQELAGSDLDEWKTVTELPEGKARKSKAMNYHSQSTGEGFSEPIFPKRKHNTTTKHSNSRDEIRNLEPAAANNTSECYRNVSQEQARTKTSTIVKAKVASKWSEYITEEDHWETRSAENMATKNSEDNLKTMAGGDAIVEEDIHPDFK